MSQETPDQAATAARPPDAGETPLSQLERQVERGSFFTHTAIGKNFTRLSEVESFLYGLIDVLFAKGMISTEEVKTAAGQVEQEMAERGERMGAGVAIRVDKPEDTKSLPVVDCAARMHVCHAICCKLDFALTTTEVESGKVKWDLGRPYFIRHEANGCCTHNDRQTGGCGVYADRPAICRGYTCAEDKRIWKDFDKMELNEEWLNQNLPVAQQPHVVRALMHKIEYLSDAPAAQPPDEPQHP